MSVLLVLLLAAGAAQDLQPRPPEVGTLPGPPKPLPQVASTFTIVSGEELRASGVRFLTDALRLAPGLEVGRLSSTESCVSVRGYNDDTSAAQGILGLIDGRQAYNEFFGGVLWDNLPLSLDEVKQIEVLRGPGSFAHGPNAMHGLVNIITRSPLDYAHDETRLSSGFGSYGSSTAGVTIVHREKNSALKAKAGWDDITQFHDREDSTKDKVFTELRYETQIDVPGHTLDLSAGVSRQKFDVLIPPFGVVQTAHFSNEADEYHARVLYRLADLRLQLSWTRFDAVAVPDASYVPFEVTTDTEDADVQWTLPRELSGAQTVTMGIGARSSAFDTEDQDISGGRHRTALYWAFLQDEIAVVKNELLLTIGLRWDGHSTAGDSISPRAALVWRFMEEQFLRASAGDGFRNPSLREIWFDMPTTLPAPFPPALITGNRDLEPEHLRSFELAWIAEAFKPVRIEVATFYNRIEDLVSFLQVGPLEFAPQNDRKEDAYGVEADLRWTIAEGLGAFARYAYTVRRDRETHDRVESAPLHKASAGIKADLPEPRLSAMAWATFFDDIDILDTSTGASLGEVDSHLLVHARVSHTFENQNLTVYAQAFNLLDSDHREQPQADAYGMMALAGLEYVW